MASISTRTTRPEPLRDTGKATSGDTPRRLFKVDADTSIMLTRDECFQWSRVLTEAGNDMLAPWEIELLNGSK